MMNTTSPVGETQTSHFKRLLAQRIALSQDIHINQSLAEKGLLKPVGLNRLHRMIAAAQRITNELRASFRVVGE